MYISIIKCILFIQKGRAFIPETIAYNVVMVQTYDRFRFLLCSSRRPHRFFSLRFIYAQRFLSPFHCARLNGRFFANEYTAFSETSRQFVVVDPKAREQDFMFLARDSPLIPGR